MIQCTITFMKSDYPLGSEFKTSVGKIRVVRTDYSKITGCAICAFHEHTRLCNSHECVAQRRNDNIPVYFELI